MGRVSGLLKAMGFHLGEDQRRKIVALDRELDEMEAKVQSLETENLNLRAKVNPLERQVERLQNQSQQKPAPAHLLEDTEIEMMKFIGNARSITAADLRNGMHLHSVHVEHCLGRLKKSGHIDDDHVPMVGAMYSLTDKGNAYLVENRLIPLPGKQAQQADNPKGHRCDHCGSVQLRRTGSRPDPTFRDLGIKQALYSCLSCGKESGFTDDKSSH